MCAQRTEEYDVAVLGSGFAGTLIAIIARRLGRSVLLIERGRHPRFAIGESSTPLADLKLGILCDRFGLDRLKPFAQYGTWKREYSDVTCGLKRGFSFFRHQRGERFAPNDEHDNELLVAANPNDESADTHWFRSEFDAFLVTEAIREGVHYVDQCDLQSIESHRPWQLTGNSDGRPFDARCDFLIDGTGHAARLADALEIKSNTESLRTRSRAIYSHFVGVEPWSTVYADAGGQLADHPFHCDAAALHHVIDGGWMWVLRFDNGITSAGFSLDPTVHPLDPSESAETEWQRLLHAYPSIAAQFRNASLVRPLTRTDRIQRRLADIAGDDWALLPHTAYFLDPWLSTGIAHSMFGIERLAAVLEAPAEARRDLLADYSRRLNREIDFLDRIIATSLANFDSFETLTAVTMTYFCAAISLEEQIRAGVDTRDAGFLLAGDKRYSAIVGRVLADHGTSSLAPYNTAGLCDPSRRNMYPYLQS